VEQTGYGITPIAALAINYKRLSFGLRFEYNTSIEMENDTKVNQVGLDNYNDGVKSDNDIPASVYAGVTYSLLDNLRLSLGYGHWFDSKANLPGKLEHYAGDTDEFLYGVEVDFLTRWTLSGGVQVTRYDLSDEYLSEMNIILDNTTFGFGLAFRATDWLKFNLGYFHSLYKDWEEDVEHGKNTYKRESRGVGVGIDLDI
jgi:long-subunit fatty acid transport protein